LLRKFRRQFGQNTRTLVAVGSIALKQRVTGSKQAARK
jgi:hypothetical protein